MDGITRLFTKWIKETIGREEFLTRLEQEKALTKEAILRWWRSPPAFEAVWFDLGGFNEMECERRVRDSYSEAYAKIVRKFLKPVLSRRVADIPEMRLFYQDVKPILLSDLYDRAERAETVEDVYFLLGDDLTHYLVLHLRRYLMPARRH